MYPLLYPFLHPSSITAALVVGHIDAIDAWLWQKVGELNAAYALHFCLVGFFAKDFIRVVTANQAALISASFSPKLGRSRFSVNAKVSF